MKRACNMSSFFLSKIKAEHGIIRCWSRFETLLLLLSQVLTPFNCWLKHIYASWDIFLYLFGIIASYCWIRLLEVYIYCYGLDEIQRVIFIERQSKACFGVKLSGFRVPLNGLWIVLARTHLYFGINVFF
jgi:hypothetical protein